MEAMSAITNAFNMRIGTYKDLQMVAPDGEWRESFWSSQRFLVKSQP